MRTRLNSFWAAAAILFFALVLFVENRPSSFSLVNAESESAAESETAGLSAGLPAEDSSSDEEEKSETSSAAEMLKNAPKAEQTKRIEKWIPDQKILAGAPPTVIYLQPVIDHFLEEGTFGDAEEFDSGQLNVTILDCSKKDVVTPVVSGNELRLNWNGTKVDSTSIMLKFTYQGREVYDTFTVEVWKPDFWMMGLIVLGGLGIFIFGMKNLSEGIQRFAGPSLRRMIAMFTEHRIFAFGVGILITVLLQSSTVTTLMTIGFVNSQIISLSQAIGVILGANIGTTITSWILTLNISAYSLPIVGTSALFFIFCKSERVRYLAGTLMGLGFIFFGMKLMGDGFSSLKELPEFSAFLQMFSAATVPGRLKCVLAGCILTVLIQSSAASIGIVMSLAMIGAFSGDVFPTAVAFILGENIGTTLTAILAAIGTSVSAKRTAAFHALFNILGVCWVLALYRPVFIPMVEQTAGLLKLELIPFGIPLAHSMFNLTNALLFLPFTKSFAKLLTWAIPDRGRAPQATETGLDLHRQDSPAIAILQSRLMVERMGKRCCELGETILEQVSGSLENDKEIQASFREEEVLDRMQDEIINFTSGLLSRNLTSDVASSARAQLRIADEIESVSDYFISILKSDLKLKNDGLTMPEETVASFHSIHEKTLDLFRDINRAYSHRVKAYYFLQSNVYAVCKNLTSEIKEVRLRFMTRMSEERLDPLLIVAVNSQLTFYRRIWEHLQNIAEAFCPSQS